MKDREHGFTLVEVLVAMALLGIVMMGVFAIYSQCTGEINRAKNRTITVNCAQRMLESLEASPYPLFAYHGATTASLPEKNNPIRADILRWAETLQTLPGSAVGTISVVDDTHLSYTLLVTVTINYENHGRTMTTVLTRRFPQAFP